HFVNVWMERKRPIRGITPSPVTALSARPGVHGGGLRAGLLRAGLLRVVTGRSMGTHGGKEPKERLNSPKRAKEFIYGLHPAERACLLGQLQDFESLAAAQGQSLWTSFHSSISIRALWKGRTKVNQNLQPKLTCLV
uniref:Uncharacterized protein n=1 Tax=Neogobius melanostomus TaxID=47308 RepID=A0A8C6S2B0_9GOBI